MPTEDLDGLTMGKGTILFWKSYEFFETGEAKDSLFLILSDCRNNSYLAIRATTKTEFYEKPSNMTREFLLISAQEEVSFPKKTVFDFAHIRTLHLENIKGNWNKGIKKINPISDKLLNEVDKRMKGSKIVRRDWIKWILESPWRNHNEQVDAKTV